MTRVLVARLDSMGDVLVSGPAIRAVAASSSVTLLAGPQGAAAGRMLPGVAAVETWACPWITPTTRAVDGELVAALGAIVDRVRPDEAVLLTSFHQSPLPLALLLRLAGVPRITGASTDAASGLLDVRIIPGEDFDEDVPEPVRALTIAAAAGFRLPPGDDGRLAVEVDDALPDEIAALGRYLVLHPGAAVPARAWPEESCRDAVAALAARGHRVVVTGGPDERALTARVAGDAGLDLGGGLGLPGLAAVLRHAAVLISGNTGPAHLAAAVGTPVVSLFAPVVPAVRWAPYGVPVVLLGDQAAACAGSRARLCPVPGHPCLTGVRADEVVAAAEGLIAGSGIGPRPGEGKDET